MAILRGFPSSNTISPSVRIAEKDYSFYDVGESYHRAGLIGFCSKGPIGIPHQITTQRQLTEVYGYPHPDISDPYLIYAASQYLLMANELWIVRVADTSPVSWEQATTAQIAIKSAGGQCMVATDIQSSIAHPVYTFPYDCYFRWRLNGVLASKALQVLADDAREMPLTGQKYSALQLADDLNLQLEADDGIEFWVTEDNELGIRSTFAFGPSAEIEFVSVYHPMVGGTVRVDTTDVLGHTATSGGVNTIGLGIGMTRAMVSGETTCYPTTGSASVEGQWDFTSLAPSANLSLQVVVDGYDNVLLDNVIQVVNLNALKSINGGKPTTAQVVAEINNQVRNNLPGGFMAIGGGVKALDDIKLDDPRELSDSTLTAAEEADSITLITFNFGRDAKIYVKPASTADAYLGLPNETGFGDSPIRSAGDADADVAGRIRGDSNTTGDVTFTITADSPGLDGNATMVRVRNDLRGTGNPVPGGMLNATGTFSIEVYNNGNQVEVWGNLTKDETSRFYASTFISLVSNWIRVIDNPDNPATPMEGDYYLTGGSDGIPADPDLQDKLLIGDPLEQTGLYTLSEPEQVEIDLVAIPGHSSSWVMDRLINFCAFIRMDCMAIIDPPFGLYLEEVIHWHNGVHPLNDLKLDSDFAALYWPWVMMTDPHNGVDVWVPPSGSILAVYAYNDMVAAPWFAPAGLNRGQLINVKDVFYRPSLEERDLLYGWRNAVNPIVHFNDIDGFLVWGQKTLQRKPTALDRVNVRRMMLVAEKRIRKFSRWLLFEPHDDLFHQQFIQGASAILDDIKAGRGLHEYKIKADWEINTPQRVDRNEFWAKIGIQPTKAVEFMFIEFSIHRTNDWSENNLTF